MATTRLRRTFRYVSDEDDLSDEPDVLDEQEQDELIQTLARQNQLRNEQFRRLLVAVPLLAMVPFLFACTSPPPSSSSSSSTTTMLPLLGLTSLAATAYLLHRQPATMTGIAALDAWSGAARSPSSSLSSPSSSPLDRYLPLLNAALCTMLLLSLFLPRPPISGTTNTSAYLILASLPALVYGVVVASKATMAGVDPEHELGRLRYNYKGA